MSNIDSSLRSPFFPRSNDANRSARANSTGRVNALQRNSFQKSSEITNRTSQDARVDIPDAIRDFSRIKKAAHAAPEIDNSAKMARLKQQIQSGTYEVDFDAVADKILKSEF
jgi:negative regulator of flagellin synthesis FlgM